MDYLKPPTENLYKFMAIGGLAICALSSFYFVQYANDAAHHCSEIGQKIAAIRSDFELLDLRGVPFADLEGRRTKVEFRSIGEAELPKETVEKIQSEFQDLKIECLKRADIPDPNDQVITQYWMGLLKIDEPAYKKMLADANGDNLLNRTIQSAREQLKDVNQLPSLLNSTVMYMRNAVFLRRCLLVASAIGGVLAFYGFLAWYFRVQRYEDAKLRAEAEKDGQTAKRGGKTDGK